VAVDPQNSDVFVMNARDHEVDVYTSGGGALITHFGSLGTGPGQFTDDPRGVSVSDDGSLAFVTDSGGKRIEVFSLSGSANNLTATFAYSIPSGTGNGKFVGPRGLVVTPNNRLLVTDEWGFDLHEYSFTPGTTSFSSTENTTPVPPPVPGVNSPRGLQVGANGKIYIMDYWNQRVEYAPDSGNTISGASTFGFRGNPSQAGAINFAWGIAIQPGTGDVFVANRESDQVESFSPTGTEIAIYGKNGTADGDFSFPQGIAFAPDGSLLVVDSANDRIERFTMSSDDKTAKWIANYGQKGTGVSSPAGDLNQPTGISVASDGTIWVADTLNNRVQSMSPSGTWTVFTTAGGIKPGFNVPWGVTVAPDGNIWVSDTGHNRIVSMTPSGGLVFQATGATIGVPGNSTIYPFAIAFDGSGRAFLSDIWNNRVLLLSTSG
jgi:sugar lactone lactonase YvrE